MPCYEQAGDIFLVVAPSFARLYRIGFYPTSSLRLTGPSEENCAIAGNNWLAQ